MTQKDTYSISSGKHYNDMEYIRLRPRFYLGGQVYNCAAREVTDNAFDEIIKGYGTTVTVTINPDHSITVLDDGRGVPAEDVDKKTGMNGIMFFMGQPRAGSNFGNEDTTSSGTNGIGVSATNAVSSRMDVTAWRGGKQYLQSFKEGIPGVFSGTEWGPDQPFKPNKGGKLIGKKSSHPNGTEVRFLLDSTVQEDDALDIEDMLFRLNTMCRLTQNSTLILDTTNAPKGIEHTTVTYSGPWGIEPLYQYVFTDKDTISTVSGKCTYTLNTGGKQKDLPISWEIAFAPAKEPEVYSFVNGVYAPEGGSHHTSILKGLGLALEDKGSRIRGLDLKKGESAPSADDYAACVKAVISVRTPTAPYANQDKVSTRSVPMANALRASSQKQFGVWADQQSNSARVKAWSKLALTHQREVESIKITRARVQAGQKSMRLGENMRMPEKLLPSRVSGPGSGAELFICEGDSAASALKGARNSQTEAIFPIRGKIPNVYDMTAANALKNKEIAAIMTILNTSIGSNCQPEKCRYDKIIIATDSDPDGIGHIASLCIILFYRMFPGIIERGMLYIAQPPLFIVSKGKQKIYCLNENEKNKALKKLGRGATVTREKGLGETDPDSLHDTVMNPDTRILIQIKNDMKKARGFTLTTFFGAGNGDARKEWIATLDDIIDAESDM